MCEAVVAPLPAMSVQSGFQSLSEGVPVAVLVSGDGDVTRGRSQLKASSPSPAEAAVRLPGALSEGPLGMPT